MTPQPGNVSLREEPITPFEDVAMAAHTANHAALAGMWRLKSRKLWRRSPRRSSVGPVERRDPAHEYPF